MPFLGYMPKIFAGDSAVTSTNRSSDRRARIYAMVIGELHSVLDARAAIRNLGEVPEPEGLLVSEAERAVVGRDHLQHVVSSTPPKGAA